MMMRAPFPWFGGKSRVAPLVWSRFGDVPNYVEPFAGSLAVVLGRPHAAGTETVNDLDCYLANFWRALAADPDTVAHYADWPVNEADLHARHNWLVDQVDFRTRMHAQADYYDPKIAGWWVWGLCLWIGDGWCTHNDWGQQLPHLGNAGRGVHRPSQQLPHLGDTGRGVHRPSQQLPHLGDAGRGQLVEYFRALSERLRNTRVACGEWYCVLGQSVTVKHGTTGVFLDPPYDEELHSVTYAAHRAVSAEVREWALANGENPQLRIALCGYEGEHEMPRGWECVPWKARGGYGAQSDGTGRENSARERVWFSPHCLGGHETTPLFAEAVSR